MFAQMSRKVEELSRIGEDSKKSTSNSVNKEANKYILIPVRSKIGAEQRSGSVLDPLPLSMSTKKQQSSAVEACMSVFGSSIV